MRTMKIALITPWGHEIRCGIRSYSEELVKPLAEQGADIYVIRYPRWGIKQIEILRAMVDTIPRDVDLIHVQHEYGLFQGLDAPFYEYLKQVGKPIVTTMHATGYQGDQAIDASSTRIIAHNRFCAKLFPASRVKIGSTWTSKVKIIAHGCKPTKTVASEEAKKGIGIPPNAPIVGYLGYISPYKGLETLIDTMVSVPEAALLIAGSAPGGGEPYLNGLKQHSLALLSGRCQWTGYVPDERLPTIYGAIDVLVYPSRFISESGALLLALSHGKAVVARRLGPTSEKAHQRVLLTFKDPKQLAQHLHDLFKNPDLRKTFEDNAMKYAEANNWSEVAKRHISLYRQVISVNRS